MKKTITITANVLVEGKYRKADISVDLPQDIVDSIIEELEKSNYSPFRVGYSDDTAFHSVSFDVEVGKKEQGKRYIATCL